MTGPAGEPDSPLLSIRNVSLSFGKLNALREVNLKVYPGEIFALLGMNGAGKTSLIESITGLQNRFTGEISVAGLDVRNNYRQTRQLIGLVPQELNFDGFFQAGETVTSQGRYFGIPAARDRARHLLARFSLASKEKANTRTLSGGMKRRLMICKALMHDPPLLFLDEPTAGVDVELREDLWKYVRELRSRGTTVFLTTHYLEEAETLADRVGILNEGRLLLVEQRDQLLARFGKKSLRLSLDATPDPALSSQIESLGARLSGPAQIDFHLAPAEENSPTGQRKTAELFSLLTTAGRKIIGVDTHRSRLEDIFRELLAQEKNSPS